MTCTACDLGLRHCHAALVEHDDATTTCLEGCDGPRAVHDVVLACGEVGLGCCGEPAAAPTAAAGPDPAVSPGLAPAA